MEKIIIGKGQILWKNIIFQNKIIPYEYKPVYYLFFIIQFTIIKHKSDKFLLHYRNSSIKFKRKVMRIYVILAQENIMSTQKYTQVYIFWFSQWNKVLQTDIKLFCFKQCIISAYNFWKLLGSYSNFLRVISNVL